MQDARSGVTAKVVLMTDQADIRHFNVFSSV